MGAQWAVENRLRWVFGVTFGDGLFHLRKGRGARNMSTVRHCAIDLVRGHSDNGSIKSRQ